MKKLNFTNWNGYKNKYLFVKIFSGFYFFQEIKRIWENQKKETIDDDVFFKNIPLKSLRDTLINLTSPLLFEEDKNMIERVLNFCRMSGQDFLYSHLTVADAILKSLVIEYKTALKEIEEVCGYKMDKVFIVGGGSQNELFCKWISSALNRELIAGYTESAINGNAICQLINLKVVKNLDEGRNIIRNSFKEKKYWPSRSLKIDWDYLEEKYIKLKNY